MIPIELDKKKGEVVLYDMGCDLILEEALNCLFETDGNVLEASKFVSDRLEKSLKALKARCADEVNVSLDMLKREIRDDEKIRSFSEESYASLKEHSDRWDRLKDEVIGWFQSDSLARKKLGELVDPVEPAEIIKVEDDEGRTKMVRLKPQFVHVSSIRSLARGSSTGLILSIINGYTINTNSGITKSLYLSYPDLYNCLFEVWNTAVNDIHPFQRGPTHQGTKHCAQVLSYLTALSGIITAGFSPPVRALMSIAAALHDLGKADILANPNDPHALIGATLIQNLPHVFKLDPDLKETVSRIIRTHNPEFPLAHIGSIGRVNLVAPSVNIYKPIQIDMDLVCAFFQLADVISTTIDRVSFPIFEVLTDLYSKHHNKDKRKAYVDIKKIVEGRAGIWSIQPTANSNPPPPWICKASISPKPYFKKTALARIREENKSLRDTGASDVLRKKTWPFEITT
jgi:hypothetical protein